MRATITVTILLVLGPAGPAVGQAFWSDDFEAPSNPSAGTRTVLGFGNADGGFCGNDYFVRTNLEAGGHVEFQGDFTNRSNDFYWRAEDFDSCIPATGQIDWTGIPVAGRADLAFRGRFGARDTVLWEATDRIWVSWRIDGGSYQNGLCISGAGGALGTSLVTDVGCDGTGDAGGFVLVERLSEFSFPIPATGTVLDVRMMVNTDAGGEELAFDLLQLEDWPAGWIFSDGFETARPTNWTSATPAQ